jgi:hypothetical protein
MLFLYRIKWFFHCLIKLHCQATIYTREETFVGCNDCNIFNDKEGRPYKLTDK